MNWLSLLTGRGHSTTIVKVSGKEIEILCSARANKALSQREQPLVAELELAFACVARKQVRFHDPSPGKEVIGVNEKLALLITAIIQNTCEVTEEKSALRFQTRNFMPKWVRIDFAKGEWVGDYGL
jgi:hypothetical protein